MKQGRLDNAPAGSDLDDDKSVNPLDGLSNLGDVMLVLAVGIMLALITAWNVDISLTTPGAADAANPQNTEQLEDAAEIGNVDISPDTEIIDESDLKEYGKVYIDADGNFYVEPKN